MKNGFGVKTPTTYEHTSMESKQWRFVCSTGSHSPRVHDLPTDAALHESSGSVLLPVRLPPLVLAAQTAGGRVGQDGLYTHTRIYVQTSVSGETSGVQKSKFVMLFALYIHPQKSWGSGKDGCIN